MCSAYSTYRITKYDPGPAFLSPFFAFPFSHFFLPFSLIIFPLLGATLSLLPVSHLLRRYEWIRFRALGPHGASYRGPGLLRSIPCKCTKYDARASVITQVSPRHGGRVEGEEWGGADPGSHVSFSPCRKGKRRKRRGKKKDPKKSTSRYQIIPGLPRPLLLECAHIRGCPSTK